jgi:hypothetical protein
MLGPAAGPKFTVGCGKDWPGGDMYINFTTDLFECQNQRQALTDPPCVGVSRQSGIYGPKGPSGGHVCYFKWNVTGSGTPSQGVDAATKRKVAYSRFTQSTQ